MGAAKRTPKRTTKKPGKQTGKPPASAKASRSRVSEEDVEPGDGRSAAPEREEDARPVPASSRIDELGDLLRDLIQELGEAKERAARAETKAAFLTDLNAELRARLDLTERKLRDKPTTGANSGSRTAAAGRSKWGARRRGQRDKAKDLAEDFDLDTPPEPKVDLR